MYEQLTLTESRELMTQLYNGVTVAATAVQAEPGDDGLFGLLMELGELHSDVCAARMRAFSAANIRERRHVAEVEMAAAVDRVFDLGGDNDPPEYQPDEDGDQ